MRRKIYVTASEMLELRRQGMSNHDIAKALEISYQTVVRYIGKQGRHMEGLAAFKDTPPQKQEQKEEVMPVIPKYEPKPTKEMFKVGNILITIDHGDKVVGVTVVGDMGSLRFTYEQIPDLVQFLAWAMRTRMEVDADAEEDKQQAEGCAV